MAAAFSAISSRTVSTIWNGFAGRSPGCRHGSRACLTTAELETTVAMAMQFSSGALASLSMSCASYLGIGHRIEFFGEDGTLVLHNPGADYMRGFELWHGKRAAALVANRNRRPGRRKISRRSYRAGIAAGQTNFSTRSKAAVRGDAKLRRRLSRADYMIDAARRSHSQGQWIDVTPSRRPVRRNAHERRILVTGGSGFIGSAL